MENNKIITSEDFMKIVTTAAAVAYFGQGAYMLAKRAINEVKLKKRYKDWLDWCNESLDSCNESLEKTTIVEG